MYTKIPVLQGVKKLPYAFLLGLSVFFIVRYGLWWFQPAHIPNNQVINDSFSSIINIVLFAGLSFVVFFGIIIRIASWYAAWFMAKPKEITPQKGLRVGFLTCYVPGSEPISMLKSTLEAMLAVSYPHDSWVLDEGNDPEVQKLCNDMGVKYCTRSKSRRFRGKKGVFKRKTKAGNLNAWRYKHEHNYDVVAQVDMDHQPKEQYLLKTLGYFSDPRVGFVGMPQIYKNLSNWISKGASEQTHFFYGPIQMGYYGKDMPFLIGTSHVYRTKAMRDIGGYSPTIAEDHLTGLTFHSKGWKSIYVPEVLAEGNGPLSWSDYFGQQMRWSYGLFEILFRYSPKLLLRLKNKQRFHYFLSQIYYFSGVSYLVGSLLTLLYLILGLSATTMSVSEWILYSLPPFMMGYIVQIYLHQFHINPKKEPVFGVLGMLLGIGANMIYAVAFLRFITGRKLQYKVTTKGVNAGVMVSGIQTFQPHTLLGIAMTIALYISMQTGHTSFIIRMWAISIIASTGIILLSNYYYYFIQAVRGLLQTLSITFFPIREIRLSSYNRS